MKTLIVFLAMLATVRAAESPSAERVLTANTREELKELQTMLNRGFTVKHQCVVGGIVDPSSSTYSTVKFTAIFILIPPAPEVLEAALAAEEAERKAALAKRRAEWLAKQPQVEKR